MVVDESTGQSVSGQITSGYLKATGYTNIVGIIISFIIGGLMVLGGMILALLFRDFFPLVFSGIGLIIIFFGWIGWRHSKKMREGKYYKIGNGWTTPQ
ncbi:MAG: hypothetical protein KKF50_01790 [Nanoarchaeota archaeon]|nr:hypothetical protein [Nanoarchaeota archaeon]